MHRYVYNHLWLLSRRPKWAHISWLCFFQHFIGPAEANFSKIILNFRKIRKRIFSETKSCKKSMFFIKIVLFSRFSSSHPESEICMFLPFFRGKCIFLKVFKFSFFSYGIFMKDQLNSLTSCDKSNNQRRLFLISMDS